MWVRLIARMFEAMAGNFAYSADIQLFLNVLSGAALLHAEDSCIMRYVMATFINAAFNFKNIFSTNGYVFELFSSHHVSLSRVFQVLPDYANFTPSLLPTSDKQAHNYNHRICSEAVLPSESQTIHPSDVRICFSYSGH